MMCALIFDAKVHSMLLFIAYDEKVYSMRRMYFLFPCFVGTVWLCGASFPREEKGNVTTFRNNGTNFC
jgi:hypothetical protein